MRRNLLSVVALCVALGLPCGAAAETDETLYLGVVSFYYPRLMFIKYHPLVDYLSEQTGSRWELKLTANYQQTVDELCAGRLTAAYLGPLTYVRARAACDVEPVLRLNTSGQATFRSYVLVKADDPIRELADLKGKRFAFGSALSTSSHLVPRSMLAEAGLEPGENLRCEYFEHHEEAVRAVMLGEADACGVRDIVGERFLNRGLRLLVASDPIPNFPVALAPGTPDAVRRGLVRALVELPRDDPEIAATMATWDRELADGFVTVADVEYDAIRRLARKVLGPDVLTRPEEDLRCAGPNP